MKTKKFKSFTFIPVKKEKNETINSVEKNVIQKIHVLILEVFLV